MQLSRLAAIGASAAAFFGSCCALPLLILGLTGGTVGFASALAPYQKYFTVLTIVLLGTAFYLVYGRKQVVCDPPKADKLCSPASQKWTKILLWISTALAAIFLIGPHLVAP